MDRVKSIWQGICGAYFDRRELVLAQSQAKAKLPDGQIGALWYQTIRVL